MDYYTWYIRDAQGNVMAVYEKRGSAGAILHTETHLYGSSRLGILKERTKNPVNITVANAPDGAEVFTFTRGEKFFEITNHLGNVLAVVADKKLPVKAIADNSINFWLVDVVTATSYYPFGMGMPDRSGKTYSGIWVSGQGFTDGGLYPTDLSIAQRYAQRPSNYVATRQIELLPGFETGLTDEMTAEIIKPTDNPNGSTGTYGGEGSYEAYGYYRYGFNGQERSPEINDNSFTAEFWQYDASLGRRWNVDPVVNPSESPYATFSNNPILMVDPNGSTPLYHEVKKGDNLENIAKQYGTTVSLLAQLNNIKHPHKINVGDVLTVGTQPSTNEAHMAGGKPEENFINSPLTGYNNTREKGFVEGKNWNVKELSLLFGVNVNGVNLGQILPKIQNLVFRGGDLFTEEIKKLPSLAKLIRNGIEALNADGKLTPGEFYRSSFNIGKITEANGLRILAESLRGLDIFDSNFSLRKNKFFSAENWLGSYGFSMRVTAYGTTVFAVYDSKTIQSATDRRKFLRPFVPNLFPTYQRYIWEENIESIQKEGTEYEDF